MLLLIHLSGACHVLISSFVDFVGSHCYQVTFSFLLRLYVEFLLVFTLEQSLLLSLLNYLLAFLLSSFELIIACLFAVPIPAYNYLRSFSLLTSLLNLSYIF